MFYDPVAGHFLTKINGKFCDWTGIVKVDEQNLYEWDKLGESEPKLKKRIERECTL